jgi:allantoin racemase
MGVSDKMQESLGIPVVNPAIAALKVLEGLVIAGLSHSKKAYPFPPKKV